MCRSALYYFVLASLFFTCAARAQEPSGAFLREWLVLGPIPLGPGPEHDHLEGFELDQLATAGGVAVVDPAEGEAVEVDGELLTWQYVTAEDGVVSLDSLTAQENVAAYAFTEVTAEGDTVALCALGTNDGARLWVNGEEVFDFPGGRALKLDDDVFPVTLQSGVNRVLLKIEERGNLWQFALRLLPVDQELLKAPLRLFDIDYTRDGAPRLRFRHGAKVSRALIEEAHLTLYREGEDEPLWDRMWDGTRTTDIPVDTPQFERYVLDMTATLVTGEAYEERIQFSVGTPQDYTLFDQGASDYVIAVPAEASEDVRWAAEELQHWLAEAGAPKIPLESSPAMPVHALLLRPQDEAPVELTPLDVAPQAFHVYNEGGQIAIRGGDDAGLVYGVMTFLGREFGVRWYSPSVSVAPERETYTFRRVRMLEKPAIRVRNDFYHEAFDPIWAARNRCNGAMTWRDQPGGVEAYWAVHTFFPLLPPEEFFEDHPEYYSLIDGERRWERAQLCLTNPDVLEIITARLLKRMGESPEYLIYSISQNDWRNPCQCEDCQAIATREESEAGPIVWFVNLVAERVEKEFPDKFVGTLAYQYTRKPPKTIRPRENVVIRLCSIECCFAHPFTECAQNAEFLDDLHSWAEIAPHLYIWDYVVNFSHYVMPYPNFPVLGPNIQTFRENKAIGIMEQGAYQSRGAEFAELRMWVLANLLWDPKADLDALVDDFMYGYYGRAGQYMRAYYDLVHAQVTPDTHFGLGLGPDDSLFSDAFVNDAERLFDAAERVADNREILERVELARLPIMYLKCLRQPEQAIADGTYDRFCIIAEHEQVTHFAEAGEPHRRGFHDRMEAVRARLGPGS